MDKVFDLSVVIISWKMKELLQRCLNSIFTVTSGINYELILVDNNSQDGTIEMIENNFPQVKLLKNSINRGVAPARNQALRIAKGKYLVTIDADMKLIDNSLKKLYDFMENHPDVGICGAKLIYEDGTVQPSARRFPTPLAVIFRRLNFNFIKKSKTMKYFEMKDWDRNDTRAVDYVIGACQFIRREAMEQVGFLDENIFYGPEDVDYCLRMKLAGWKVYYYSDTSIIHYEQRITKQKLFSKMTWMHIKGIVYFFAKHYHRLKWTYKH